LPDDARDRGAEAHVQHPVGLVEDEHLHLAEGDDVAGDQVLEPAGRGDEQVGPAGRLALRAEADAAVDGRDLEPARLGDRAQLGDDLAGPLAGRGEDQRRGAAARLDALDQRDAEGQGLPRSGRRLDEKVRAAEGVADDQLLDGEGGDDVAARQRAADRLGDAEIGKGGDDSLLVELLGEIQRPLNALRHSEETEPLGRRIGRTRPDHRSSPGGGRANRWPP
jgi:hypothetical protein